MRTLIIVMLIEVFSLCYFEMTFAEITIDGETVLVETGNYEVQFDRGVITRIHNKLTAETYTLPAEPSFRMLPAILGINNYFSVGGGTTIETQKVNTHEAEILFRERGDEIRLRIGIDPNTGDLLISGDCVSDTPGVHGMQWGIENLDLHNLNLILPSDGGQIIDASSAIQYKNFSYPSARWEAQLAIIQAAHGGFYVRGTDISFQFKRLEYKSNAGSFGLGFRTENQAPWDTLTSVKSITWRLNTYIGDYRVPARIYRDWMEVGFDPWRLTNMPAWVSDIGLVIIYELDKGLSVELNLLSELVDPTKTLIYMVDWRKEGHDVNHPDYTNPIDGFGAFIEVAHGHGFRVMPHVNIYNVSPSHPLYPELKRFQYRRPWTGELSGWKWDEIDNPQRNAHINLASSKWRNILVQQFKEVWEKYKVDAFHLDVSHYVLNDANGLIEGLSSAQGNVLMHLELAQAMPGVVFSGEGLHEVTFFRESFAQRWRLSQGVTHPISAFLFSPYTHTYGDLGVPHPDGESSRYNAYLDSYEGWGVLPTIRLWREGQLNGRFIQQILSTARAWQDLGLKPDFESDWGPNALFQYTTQTGEIATVQRTPAGSTFILPDDAGYERIFGVTQVETRRSLPHWRAYNETTLLGLDPNRFYLPSNTPRDFSQLRVNSLSPNVYISETRVTDQAALFQLESTSSDRQATVGFFLPTAPVGSIPDTLRHIGSGQYTIEADLSQPVVIFLALFSQINLPYDLKEAQFNTGLQVNGIFQFRSIHGSGRHSKPTIDNVEKEGIFAHPPQSEQTILQFPLLLPQEPSTFSFSAGLEEGCSKGVLFQVRLNGQTYFETFKDTFDWTDGSISLSAFAGQPLLLELVTDPAEEGSAGANCDWAHWADLRITAEPNPDANLDGQINILDLVVVASSFGQEPPSNPLADTNKDGVVNVVDLVFVVEHLSENAAAPAQLRFIESIPSSAKEVIAAQRALTELEAIPNKSQGVQIAIELLRHYLSIADLNVQETKLLPNYPNPFNPDTWIPYQLSEGSMVTVKIYDVGGHLIRTVEVGHKPVGYHLTRERAVYWDGRNEKGESVSSGVYFYTLEANNYTETRRMVIVK